MVVVCIAAAPAAATIYHVSPAGNDAAAGSATAPWRTLAKATATASAGDTVVIHEGTYFERLVPQRSGSSGHEIVFAAANGETVTIDGSSATIPAGWGGLVEIADVSWIRISGLRVTNAGPDDNHAGILVDTASHIVVEGCTTVNTVSSGIGVWSSSHITIDGNEIIQACNDGEQECLTVATTDTFTVTNNHVHDGGPGSMGGEGIDIKDGATNGVVRGNRIHDINRVGLYVDAWDKPTHDIVLDSNTVYRCEAGIAVTSEAGGVLERVRCVNNLIYDNETVGFTLGAWGETVPSRPVWSLEVINNTFVNNGAAGSSWGGGISLENSDARDVVIRNNVVASNSMFQISNEATITNLSIDHNLIHGWRGFETEVRGNAFVEADPLLVDAPAGDLHLQEGSPAIDAGSSTGAPATDADGAARPNGAGIDIGAYEHGATTDGQDLVVWIPVAANVAGSFGSQWATDVVAFNETTEDCAVTAILHTTTGDVQTASTIVGGAQGVFEDIVGVLGATGKGALELRSSAALRVAARVYNSSETGTFGQSFVGVNPEDTLSTGSSAWLAGLRQEEGLFRSNLAFTNTSGQSATVRVRLLATDGTERTRYTVTVPPHGLVQDVEPFKTRAAQPNLGWGIAQVTVTSGTGIIASASVIDSRTNDATTVPMLR
jgi:hypothetical protein